MVLGKRLKKLRKEMGIKQKELAIQLNLNQVSISGYEREERQPDNQILVKLARHFETSTDYLLGLSNDPHPNYAINKHDVLIIEEANISEDDEQFLEMMIEVMKQKQRQKQVE